MTDEEKLKMLLVALHHSSFRNKEQIDNSNQCGCFHCGKIFPATEVVKWCDIDDKGAPTAVCHHCGTDSVLGDGCGFTINHTLLKLMNDYFFGGRGFDEEQKKVN